jgi:hypothetical protein
MSYIKGNIASVPEALRAGFGLDYDPAAAYEEVKKKRQNESPALDLDTRHYSSVTFRNGVFEKVDKAKLEYFMTLKEEDWDDLFDRYKKLHPSLYREEEPGIELEYPDEASVEEDDWSPSIEKLSIDKTPIEKWSVEPYQPYHDDEAESKKVYSLADLGDMDFPEQRFLAKDIILLGTTTILAGRPKKGKSWAAFDLSISVATGGNWMNHFACERGDVLFLALEDTKRRMKERALKLLQGQPIPKNLYVKHYIDKDGTQEDYLERKLKANPNLKLIVIDTLQMYRTSKAKKGSDYEHDYESIAAIHRLSKKYNVAILLVHHTKKAKCEETVDEVSGTTGITGAVDTWLILAERQSQTRLQGAGRDIEPVNFPVELSKETSKWEIIDEEAKKKTKQDQARDLIREFLSEGPKLSTAIKEAVKGCGISTKTIEIVQKEDFIIKYRVTDPDGSNHSWWKLNEEK